ncbi:MAG: Na+/H+ antiporter NhaC family protein [Pseudomonadota bacterium]|nr:Na+/H+ antiporter NhaC family protein [Pseudomonadota bacterium]
MNAVVCAIAVMVLLALSRVSVVFALIVGAMVGGLVGGLGLNATLEAFNQGLGGGAQIALAYGILGAFAVALSRSGLPDLLAHRVIRRVTQQHDLLPQQAQQQIQRVKLLILSLILLMAVLSQNVIPVHIAFIPILIPPLLYVLNQLELDRRLVACVLTFGLVATYMLLPIGFGSIFLNDLLLGNINRAGADYAVQATPDMLLPAMALPVLGMLVGLLIAVFWSYRRPRQYGQQTADREQLPAMVNSSDVTQHTVAPPVQTLHLWIAGAAVLLALVIQLYTDSMVLGGLTGFAVLSLGRVFDWKDADDHFTAGMRMMAMIGFIMLSAAGFAAVIQATGDIDQLVQGMAGWLGVEQKALAALLMLVVGLLVTMGIGSSFSTIPILAVIYVPLAVQFGFSPLAIVALVGTAAALGDAGSPASDSTLGPTAGLNADGQHDHIWDSVVPTFLHYNLPLIAFGWLAAMWL